MDLNIAVLFEKNGSENLLQMYVFCCWLQNVNRLFATKNGTLL